MTLATLPFEVLHHILDFTRPHGFENAMLTCRRFFEVGTPLISHHNELKKKYRDVILQKLRLMQDHLIADTVPYLLNRIAAEPLIAEYITNLGLAEREHGRLGETQQERTTKHDNGLLRLLQGSPVANVTAGLPGKIFRSVTPQGESYDRHLEWSPILLMSLLPNIETIQMPNTLEPGWFWGNCGIQALHKLVIAANDASQRDQPLSKLKILYPGAGQNIRELEPFIAVNSLQEMYVASGDYLRDEFECQGLLRGMKDLTAPSSACRSPMSGNLTVLEMDGFAMSSLAFKDFLSRMQNLRDVRLRYAANSSRMDDWDVDAFIAVLVGRGAARLEQLSLTVGTRNWVDVRPLRSEGLKGFPKLKKLELDTRLFYSTSWEGVLPYGGVRRVARVEDVPKLSDLLPRSVQSLHVLSQGTLHDAKCLYELFTDFQVQGELREIDVLRGERGFAEFMSYQFDDPIEHEIMQTFEKYECIRLAYAEQWAMPEFVRDRRRC